LVFNFVLEGPSSGIERNV